MRRSVELFVGTVPGETARAGFKMPSEPEALSKIFAELRAVGVHGATIIPGWGYWHGASERFFVLYVADAAQDDIESLAYRLGEVFGQDAIGWREAAPIQLAWNRQTQSGLSRDRLFPELAASA